MTKLLPILFLSLTIFSQSHADVPLSPAKRFQELIFAKKYSSAVARRQNLLKYFEKNPSEAPPFIIELLNFFGTAYTPLAVKSSEIVPVFKILVEVTAKGDEFKEPATRAEIRKSVDALLARFSHKSNMNSGAISILNSLWLWEPRDLDFLADKYRKGYLNVLGSQTIYAFEHATNESRLKFYNSVQDIRSPYEVHRWFAYALSYVYGVLPKEDEIKLLKTLGQMNSRRILPPPIVHQPNAPETNLLTSEDLLRITFDKLHAQFLTNDPLFESAREQEFSSHYASSSFSRVQFNSLLDRIEEGRYPYSCESTLETPREAPAETDELQDL